MYQNSFISHTTIPLTSPSSTSRSSFVKFVFSYYASSTLYCFAAEAYMCTYFLLPRLPVYLFLLSAGPGPLHEIAIFSRGRSVTPNTIPLSCLPLPPRICLKCFSDLSSFFSATRSLVLLPTTSSASVIYLPDFSADITSSSRFPPISFQFSLNHVIPLYFSSPYCYFLPYSSINYGWQPFRLVCSLLYTAISTLSCLYLS